MQTNEMLQLHNGAAASPVAVATVLSALLRLRGRWPIAYVEARELAADPEHALFRRTGAQLHEHGLVDDQHRMPDDVRAVILAAVRTDPEDPDVYELVDPLARMGTARTVGGVGR